MINLRRIPKRKRSQKGIALLIVIFALLLVTGIALAMMSTSDTESQINRNYRDSQKAYFAALAGIQEARARLLTDANVVPSGAPSATNNRSAIYILNPNATDGNITPWIHDSAYFDDELCHEYLPGLYDSTDNQATPNLPCKFSPGANGWYLNPNSNDPNRGSSAALDFKWVRITQKENRSAGYASDILNYRVASSAYDSTSSANWNPICWTGTKQVPLTTGGGMISCTDHSTNNYWEPVYRVVSLAQTSSSAFGAGSRRMVIAEVAKTPPLVTNAAVDSQDHVTLHGNLTVNGYDSCSCNLHYGSNGYDTSNCPTTTNPDGSVTYNCPGRGTQTCDNKKWAIFAADTIDPANGSETLMAGPNPPTKQNAPWPYDIASLIKLYNTPDAVDVTKNSQYGWTCSPPTYDNNGILISNGSCGTQNGSNTNSFGVPPPFPPPYNADGSLPTNLSPQPAVQTTYIPGNVKLTSSWKGNGILIVDGDLEINGGLQYYGLILVRGAVTFSGGGSQSTNIIGAVLAGQESYVNNTLGGSAVVDFNSCALTQNLKPQPPRLVSIREATY